MNSLQHRNFLFVAEWRPASFNVLLTVWDKTGSGMIELINLVVWMALSSFPVVIWQRIVCLSWVDNLEGCPPEWFSLFPSTSLLILPTVPFPRPVLAWIWHWKYPSLRRETTEEHWAAEIGLMVMVKNKDSSWTKFNMPNECKKSHVSLFIALMTFLSHITRYWSYNSLKLKSSKTAPMIIIFI